VAAASDDAGQVLVVQAAQRLLRERELLLVFIIGLLGLCGM